MRKLAVLVGVAFGCFGCDDAPEHAPPDVIDERTWRVALTPGAAVPLCAEASAAATGGATVSLTADNATIVVEGFTFEELSGPATAAHIHAGAPGFAGPAVLDLGTDPRPPIAATFSAVDYPEPAPVGAPLSFGAFTRELEAGNAYVDVHTAACPAGELRAQLR